MTKEQISRLRAARIDELQELNKLCLRSKASWGYDQAFIETCRHELELREEELGSSLVEVAETGGTITGVAQIEIRKSQAHLLKMFVEPANLRFGIGTMLFRWACDEARRCGATCLIIESDPYAAQFYRRMGARDVGFAPSGSIPGRTLPKLSYELN